MVQQYTAYDVEESVLDTANGNADDRAVRVARRAIQEAYRDLPRRRLWTYYQTRAVLWTSAPYSTGTVVFDLTGGSNERELTLTGGTWPSDAAKGWVVIGAKRYRVASRVSSTVLTLDANYNPGSDIASTTYVWYRDTYPLPENCRSIDQLAELEFVLWPSLGTPGELQTLFLQFGDPSTPRQYCLLPDESNPGAMAVMFHPPPDNDYRFEYTYSRRPGAIKNWSYTTGTVSVTGGSASVTGSGTAFNQSMVGSVLRFGTASALPTGLEGDSVFAEQGVVKSVESTTALTLYDAADATHTAVKYRLSDRIDIEDGAMYTAFLRLAEAQFATMFPRDDARQRMGMAEAEILKAKEADNRNHGTSLSRRYVPARLSDMPYTLE